MEFEKFKKVFDESFGKVTSKEFIQRMENLGYVFQKALPKARVIKSVCQHEWKETNSGYLAYCTKCGIDAP